MSAVLTLGGLGLAITGFGYGLFTRHFRPIVAWPLLAAAAVCSLVGVAVR